MNPVELLSDLYALRQLYGLLQNCEGSLQHVNSNNVEKALDGRARQLLKDLLDDAAEKIFNTHLKMVATQAAVYSTPCSSQPEQPKAVPKINSPLSQEATVKSSPNKVPNDDGKDSKTCMFTSEKDGSLKKPKLEEETVESKTSISSDLPEQKKKRCRICLENNLKKQYSAKDTKCSNDRVKEPSENSNSQDRQHDWRSHFNVLDEHAKRLQESNTKSIERGNGISETLGNPSNVRLGVCSPISPTIRASKQEVGLYPIGQTEEMSDEASDYSKVVANAIKQIESRILAVQLSSSGMADSFNNDANEHGSFKLDNSFSPCTPIPTVQTEEQVAPSTTTTRRELSGMDKSFPLLGGTQLLTRQANQLLSENLTGKFASTSTAHGSSKALMERFESLSQPVSQNEKIASYVNGLRVPMPTQAPMRFTTPDQTWQTGPVQNATARKKGAARSKRFVPPQSIAFSIEHGHSSKKLMSQTRKIREVTNQRHHLMIVKPVLLDEHKPSGTHKMSYAGQQKKRMPRKQVLDLEEEESSSGCTDSETWSTWTSEEKTEVESIDGSNEYSKEDSWSRGLSRRRTRDIHMRMRGDLSSSTRSINMVAEESASSSSRDSSCSSSMEEEEDLYSHKRYQDKSVGRFRRLKNRLGLIFHHHHHHHHHHHYDRNGNSDDDRGHSPWKHLRRKMFDGHKNRHGIQESRGNKKSVVKVKNMSHNKQVEVGHFHALVEGLLRHVRHSKKSNNYLSKRGGGGGNGNGRLRNRPLRSHHQGRLIRKNKKLHWWQMLRRGRVKLQPDKAKRGRVKLGFTTRRRPKLKIK